MVVEKKIERKISRDKYIITAIITITIFILGLVLGMLFDNLRLRWAERINKESDVDYLSLQLQYLYLTSLEEKNESCLVLNSALKKSIKDLSESLSQFMTYKEKTRVNKKEYEIIGRRYILDNLRYWFFARKTKEKCDLDVVTILYFHSGKHCQICPDQGVILTYFKKIFRDELLIFPIDIDYMENEAMVSILIEQYRVMNYPTLIIEDKKYEGLIANKKLKEIICKSFEDETEICKRED